MPSCARRGGHGPHKRKRKPGRGSRTVAARGTPPDAAGGDGVKCGLEPRNVGDARAREGQGGGFSLGAPERARPTAGGRPRGLQEHRTRVPVVAESVVVRYGRSRRPVPGRSPGLCQRTPSSSKRSLGSHAGPLGRGAPAASRPLGARCGRCGRALRVPPRLMTVMVALSCISLITNTVEPL